MTHVYKPLGDGMYKKIDVQDPKEYLDNGWYLSIADHQKPVAEQKPAAKKRAPRKKKTEA